MTKRSPRGLFKFERRNDRNTATRSVGDFIAEVEAWANHILAEAGIKIERRSGFIRAPASFTNKQIEALARHGRQRRAAGGRRTALELAHERKYADVVFCALNAINKANQLRAAFDIAAAKGDETSTQALWCAFRMMEFCGTAYAGAIIANEDPLWRDAVGPLASQPTS